MCEKRAPFSNVAMKLAENRFQGSFFFAHEYLSHLIEWIVYKYIFSLHTLTLVQTTRVTQLCFINFLLMLHLCRKPMRSRNFVILGYPRFVEYLTPPFFSCVILKVSEMPRYCSVYNTLILVPQQVWDLF